MKVHFKLKFKYSSMKFQFSVLGVGVAQVHGAVLQCCKLHTAAALQT